MKANSSGSVMPVRNAVRPAAPRMPTAAFFCAGRGHVDHGERGGGQAEHQDRVEARGERARVRVAGGEAGQFAGDDGAVAGLTKSP